MDISFVRIQNDRDRVYVRRTDGTETSWVFPTYGNYVPHDLVHLVVESAFGLKDGFWGRVDSGLDVAQINMEANRTGGPNKYARLGSTADLYLAEALAAIRWSDSQLSDEEILEKVAEECRKLAMIPPEAPTLDRITRIRATLDLLCARWRTFIPKGTLKTQFNSENLERSFASLGE